MLAWFVAVCAFAAAATYAVGGREFVFELMARGRQMRSQAAAAFQPPTAAELQQVRRDTVQVAATSNTSVAPISIGLMMVWIGGILVVIVSMVFLTGRDPKKQRRD